MKEPGKAHRKDFIALLVTVGLTVLACNGLTPALYRLIVGKSQAMQILDKLNEPGFAPDLVVFGSSKSWAGIDGYQMTDELGLDVYNFSSQEQQPVESSLYYEMLPPSVKTVVQIFDPPVKDQTADPRQEKKRLGKKAIVSFNMSNYRLTDAVKGINPCYDLSDLERSQMAKNFVVRGSIIVPTLTAWLLEKKEKVKTTFKFDNDYAVPRNERYERTVEGVKKLNQAHFDTDGNIEIDTAALSALRRYDQFLSGKGIKLVAVIMPSNPDVEEFTAGQMQTIDESCRELMPEVTFFNYLSAINDPQLFFDAAHMNREGAKAITTLLDKDLTHFLSP